MRHPAVARGMSSFWLASTLCGLYVLSLGQSWPAEAEQSKKGAPVVSTSEQRKPRRYLQVARGNRIVLIGNTLAEREQYFGHWETLLHSRFPDHELVVRNLGWSADELYLRPRSLNFDQHGHTLFDHKPDIVIAFFGFNESFAGQAGLKKFEEDLERFIRETTTTKYNGRSAPQLALVSPIAHENLGHRSLPDGSENNARLELYTRVMHQAAERHGIVFVDLFHPTREWMARSQKKLTFNGIHLTDYGYSVVAPLLDEGLFGPRPPLPDPIDLARLRREILEKNRLFFYDYRAVNGYYIYGGRKEPFGVVNFPAEFQKLRKMIANRDRRIWQVAQGKPVPDKPDDRDTGELPQIPSNYQGKIVLTSPEESQRLFEVAPGFEVTLFASEREFPDLKKPCQFAFDARGRLWVCTMPSYPQYLPGEEVNDKILILEDQDGDGRADKCTVFADRLYLPTGLALGDGGVYVAQQPNLLFLKDTDGDDRADYREIVLHGFDSADSHHAISAFRWGPGGDLYFMEGTFHHTQVETPYGPQRVKNAAVFRYEPRTQKLDIFVSYPFANPWGQCWDYWGQNFIADASGGANYFAAAFSGRVIYPYKHPQMREFLHKQWRPTCGCAIVASRHFPDDMQGDYLLNNCIGFQGVLRYKFREDGSGFVADPMPFLLRSRDPNVRPTDILFGPDGALYLCDWYNPLVGHMQHSIRDPNRDRTHGRIWRVTYKHKPLLRPPRIAGAPIASLLDLLKEPEAYVREQAKLELRQRDTEAVVRELDRWIGQLDAKDPLYEHHLLEALWVCQHHDYVHENLLRKLLRAQDGRARAAATRVLCYWRDRVAEPLELLRTLVHDPHPRVRLEAIRALSFFGGPAAQGVALEALAHPLDYYLEYTFRETMATLGPLPDLTRLSRLPAEHQAPAVQVICQQGKAEDLEGVLMRVLQQDVWPRDVRVAALTALAEVAQTRRVHPGRSRERIVELLADPDVHIQALAARLVGLWKVHAALETLYARARALDTPDALRQAALEALVRLGAQGQAYVERLTDTAQPMRVRLYAVAALARVQPEAAARRAVEVLQKATDQDDPAPVIAAFLEMRGGAQHLAKALDRQSLPRDVGKLALRYMNTSGRSDADLVQALSKAAGISLNPQPPSEAELKALVQEVLTRGNAARGEQVFRRTDLGCLKCHSLAGAGGNIGPDLRDIGSNSPVDYILRSILNPDESIKEQYETVLVATADGGIFHGILVEDSAQRLVLKDANGQVRIIAKADIEERNKGPSLMPKGLEQFMTRSELVDLVRFLSELGKPGPYAMRLEPVIRRWHWLRAEPAAGNSASILPSALPHPEASWPALYALANGDVPLHEIVAQGATSFYLQAELEARVPGTVSLRLDDAGGLRLWLDEKPLPSAGEVPLQLKPGKNRLTILVDTRRRQRPTLRAEVVPSIGSRAQYQIVGGP